MISVWYVFDAQYFETIQISYFDPNTKNPASWNNRWNLQRYNRTTCWDIADSPYIHQYLYINLFLMRTFYLLDCCCWNHDAFQGYVQFHEQLSRKICKRIPIFCSRKIVFEKIWKTEIWNKYLEIYRGRSDIISCIFNDRWPSKFIRITSASAPSNTNVSCHVIFVA